MARDHVWKWNERDRVKLHNFFWNVLRKSQSYVFKCWSCWVRCFSITLHQVGTKNNTINRTIFLSLVFSHVKTFFRRSEEDGAKEKSEKEKRSWGHENQFFVLNAAKLHGTTHIHRRRESNFSTPQLNFTNTTHADASNCPEHSAYALSEWGEIRHLLVNCVGNTFLFLSR